jgi:Glycopeptide antibiotics resistance protein
MKIAVDWIALIILYLTVLYRRWQSEGRDILFIRSVMYLYLCFVLYFTMMPVITSLPFIFDHPHTLMNLVPFIDVLSGRGDFVKQVGLNVLMTVPFGFLFPLCYKENPKLSKTLLYCFLMSLGIELLQPLVNGARSSDITDIITNVFGGMLGYAFYLLFRPVTASMMELLKNK